MAPRKTLKEYIPGFVDRPLTAKEKVERLKPVDFDTAKKFGLRHFRKTKDGYVPKTPKGVDCLYDY